MSALLDTHVVLWLARTPERVPPAVRAALETADRRFVSAATAYEIAYKTRLGKLGDGALVLERWAQLMNDMLATEMSLSVTHMRRAGRLEWDHRDPFDRMLVAQAQIEDLDLVTMDQRIRSFGDVRTTDWA